MLIMQPPPSKYKQTFYIEILTVLQSPEGLPWLQEDEDFILSHTPAKKEYCLWHWKSLSQYGIWC